jgi:hypothetical protein
LITDILAMQDKIGEAIQTQHELYDHWTMSSFDFFSYFLERSMVFYRIAKLCDKKGDRQQAILYYQKALHQWKHADEDLPELIDVKARLAQLSGEN